MTSKSRLNSALESFFDESIERTPRERDLLVVTLLALQMNADLPHQDPLIAGLCTADSTALGQAYDLHHATVRSFARRLLADDAAAEDLVHDVFASLPKAAASFEGRGSLRSFLLGMTANHAKHHLRAAARRRNLASRFAAEPVHGSVDGEAEGERHDIAAALVRALDELPLEQRAAFVLLEIEERTSHEAAEIMSVPEATMRTRLFHAKRKLQGLLQDWATP